MATNPDALALLRSIDASLKTLVQIAQRRQTAAPTATHEAETASDADLDSPHGDPVIKAADPRDWHGPSMKGKKFSECPVLYLDLLAKRYDYFADKAATDGTLASNGKPLAPYNRRDAARARGWARRLNNGWKPPQSDFAEHSEWPSDSETF